MHVRPSLKVGFLLPALLIATLIADIGLRLLPVQDLTFRPWEAVRRFRPADEAFQPNRRLLKERSYGGLVALGNLPALRQYRPETFTTDAFGYRNPPLQSLVSWASRGVEGLLVGSSMATGVGNSDEEILSVQLSTLSGRSVYNGSLTLNLHNLDRIRWLAQRLGMDEGVVIFEYLESYDLPDTKYDGVPRPCFRLLDAAQLRQFDPLCSYVHGFLEVSPLQIFTQRLIRLLQNDVILPNIYTHAVVQARLRNGMPMLFAPADGERFYTYRDVRPAAEYLTWMAEELKKDNLDLLVVIVPSGYTVYRPLLADQERPIPEFVPYTDRLEAQLRTAGVPVVNLTEPFVTQALADLDRGQYIYWQDDHHWNARGIGLAAEKIRPVFDQLRMQRHERRTGA